MQARCVLGVRVHDVTYSEALEAVSGFIEGGGPHLVATPNPEFVMAAQSDPEFRAILNSAALAIPDGIGLLWAARLANVPFREHVRGTDLVLRLARMSAQRRYRWYLLGGGPGVAERAARTLTRAAPGLEVVGSYAGSPNPDEVATARQRISAVAPVHVLLVAYGAPEQERWIVRNLESLHVPVGMGVGGVFNYLAGAAPRAPGWIRRLELEWLHRLATQPWRWRRQLALPRFVGRVLLAQYGPGRPGAVLPCAP